MTRHVARDLALRLGLLGIAASSVMVLSDLILLDFPAPAAASDVSYVFGAAFHHEVAAILQLARALIFFVVSTLVLSGRAAGAQASRDHTSLA